jgi:alkanesulfonate monooxygenase SsuD/methylene tetrahydromethanopterin reductase-like flavin-dependent oxidoreductase (luciferase family)
MQQTVVALRTGTISGGFRPPLPGYYASLPAPIQRMLDDTMTCAAVGTRDVVATRLAAFIERTGVDEVILTSQIYDQAARKRSIAIAVEAMGLVNAGAKSSAGEEVTVF